jgi:hypothetical protein
MFFMHLLFALFFAVILFAFLAGALGLKGPWSRLFWLFIVLFLATWVGGAWLTPMGPLMGGAYWLPFLVAGIVFTVFLAAFTLPAPRETTVELVDEKEKEAERKAAMTALGIFFWILILLLVAAIIVRYI